MQQKCGDNKVYARRQKNLKIKKNKGETPQIHLRGRCQALSMRLLLAATVSTPDTHFVASNAHPERRPVSQREYPILGHVRAWHQYPLCSCNATTRDKCEESQKYPD